MTEDWDFYVCEVGGKWASMYLDLNIAGWAPDPKRTLLAFIRLNLQAPRPDGLSSRDESDRLVEIEDLLVPTVQQATGGVYVGRCTTGGARDFYFYLDSRRGFDESVKEAARSFPEYRYEIISGEEPAWETYFNYLFPSPVDRQRILNRRVCDSLARQGDTMAEARPLAHWAYFDSPERRDAFLADVARLGFAHCGSVDPTPEQPRHGAQVIRDDVPSQKEIDAITLAILNAAIRHGGEYDGWETKVITPKDAESI